MIWRGKPLAYSLGVGSLIAVMAFGFHRLWPDQLALKTVPRTPVCKFEQGRTAVRPIGEELLAEVGRFDDELLAYLHFDYLRSLPAANSFRVLLTSKEVDGGPVYTILFSPRDNDLVTAAGSLAELVAAGLIPGFDLKSFPPSVLENKEQQTKMFVAAYCLPVKRKLERIGKTQLVSLTERFILFKSVTDPRVRRKMEPVPVVLSRDEARQLAADILTVADFYSLPLDFFLGIGAMENNYMDVRGDSDHAVWKRRPQKGDIVLKRRRGRVLVLNYASGPWQITRETLRYAHKLYLKDDRDYSLLPKRLRPDRRLNLDEISPGVLTTYAGLLFRHLLDLFQGDIGKAAGAYNGGIRNPNTGYEEGVRRVANYARRVLEQAATLNNQAVADIQFLAPPRHHNGSRWPEKN